MLQLRLKLYKTNISHLAKLNFSLLLERNSTLIPLHLNFTFIMIITVINLIITTFKLIARFMLYLYLFYLI